jgi:hypothetical protein
MRRMLLYGAAITLALGVPGPANAASITYELKENIQWISIAGEIVTGDFDAFKAQAARVNGKAVVFLNSPGSSLVDGLQIGEFVRLKGWLTLAARCYSACAMVWLAGTPPMMFSEGPQGSQIGFHAASINGQEKGTGNALVGAYMNRLGLGYDAVLWATTASPNDFAILTTNKAKELGIEVKVFESEKPANVPPAPRPTPSPARVAQTRKAMFGSHCG